MSCRPSRGDRTRPSPRLPPSPNDERLNSARNNNGRDDYCPGCTTYTDNTDSATGRPYIYRRDTAYVTISDMPIDQFQAYAKRRGWVGRFYSSHGTTFSADCGVEGFALSVFLRDENRVYHSYMTGSRGVDRLMFQPNILDLTPLGRSEAWEA